MALPDSGPSGDVARYASGKLAMVESTGLGEVWPSPNSCGVFDGGGRF